MEIIKIIEKNNRFILRLVKDPEGKMKLIKSFAEDHPSLDSQAQLRNELKLGSRLNHPGIRKVVGEIFFENRKSVLLDFIEGKNIKKIVPMDLGTFFNFAISISGTLDYIHESGFFHRDISPYNIMYNSQNNSYQIIDFGTAVEYDNDSKLDEIVGTPAYTAPELTGRLQTIPDIRADLYSLGVVFYELLAGNNPFEDAAEMQTIYKQIAWLPEQLKEVNTAIPVTVSKIIMKLLAKQPDKRYLSAKGLIFDLEEAQLLFRRNVVPVDFEPGSSEKPPPYNNSPSLTGYTKHELSLKESLRHLISGKSQICTLLGPKGIGKTALINNMLPEILKERIMYVKIGAGTGSAKPYAYLIELLESILNKIDEEPDEQILKRKIRFNSEKISDVSFLVQKIPSLEKFVEGTDFRQEQGSLESQNRFILALQDLFRLLAIPERPIIAHVSRADKIDTESLNFLSKFVKDVKEEFVWIILEKNADQNEINSESDIDKQILLEGLNDEEIVSLFRKMIIGDVRNDQRLLEHLTSYAESNPGKAVNLVRYWYENEFFEYDHLRKYWFWKNPETQPLFPGSSIKTSLIKNKVEKDVIEWACLIDGKFSLEILTELSQYDEVNLLSAFESLNIKSQLLSVRNGSDTEYFKLSRALDPDNLLPDILEQASKHAEIAKYLIRKKSNVFRIAFHINKSIDLGNHGFPGETTMKINLEAGLRAKEEGAFQLARDYFQRATSLLDQLENTDKETCFQLYLNSAELAQLDGAHEEASELFINALKNSNTDLQTANVYARQVILHNHQGKHEEALKSGRIALETLGFSIPEKAGKLLLLRKLIGLWIKIGRNDPLKLIDLPEMEDEGVKLSLRIMESLHAAIFNKSSDLLAVVILISFERILKYGNAPEGYSAYAGFGAILALGFGNYKKGWAFTLAGASMTDRFQNKMYQGRGLFSKGAWIVNYIMHSKYGIPILEEGIQLSKESGDFSYAANGITNLVEAHFMIGTPMFEFEKRIDEYIVFTHQIGFEDILALCLVTKCYILQLTKRESLIPEQEKLWFGGRNLVEYTVESSFKHIRIYYLILDAWWQYYSGNIEKGIEDILLSKPLLYTLQGPAIIVDYYMIMGLLYYESGKMNKRKDILKVFKKSLSKLKKYAKLVEDNYSHRYLLLKALEFDLKGDQINARKKMRAALYMARKHDYIQIEGICSHYLAKWFMKAKLTDYARLHFRDTVNVYQKWGSHFLVEKVISEFPDFSLQTAQSGSKKSTSTSSGSGHSGFSNPEVLMRSALSVAAETDFEVLLEVMNTIFIEQAGATRSLLFIRSNRELRLLYAMEKQQKSYHPFPGKAFSEVHNIPKSILQLVQRSQESIYIEDSSREQRFNFEPYLRNEEAFSILVTPLIYRGDLSGIIYFENSLLTGAFSENRQELIQLLSGQFAVALQNAQLVEELEQRVSERTLALESEKDRADLLLKNILPAETAEELKIKGKATSKFHENVTVLFTDFIGFTRTSEKMHPEDLVKMLDYYFREFDRITTKHNLEKIKTIGDAYLCVAGLPIENKDHAQNALKAAMEILAFINETKASKKYDLEVRIGLHSGSVVAGVVGENKFAFDIWGDTVNTASRMESNSEAGKINITRETKELLEDSNLFTFEYRGKVAAKNKGEIDMFFAYKNTKIAIDYDGAIKTILAKMEAGLSPELTYHSIDHTNEIISNALMIGTEEGLNEEELNLLHTAAAFHDSGFMISVKDHEEKSGEIAAQMLPEYGFSEKQIKKIQKMILSTRIPQEPSDLLSKILCDADLYYLGTDDFYETGQKLFQEFLFQKVVTTEKEWIELQISFLESHNYHTKVAMKNCDAKKQMHLEQLKKDLLARFY